MTTGTERTQTPPGSATSDTLTVAVMGVAAVAIVGGLALTKPWLLFPAAVIVAVVAAARYVLVRVHS